LASYQATGTVQQHKPASLWRSQRVGGDDSANTYAAWGSAGAAVDIRVARNYLRRRWNWSESGRLHPRLRPSAATSRPGRLPAFVRRG